MQKIVKNSRGQLSIFLAITLVFFITAIAFVINIGLFVKAKINLQNAVDAGAFAGAAVQSRQLTDIAYLNWEMRNIYKEWMFKYYVLGNLNTYGVEDSSRPPKPNGIPAGMMDFTVGEPSTNNLRNDRYNIPSVCVQLGDQEYCKIYYTPGIPRMTDRIVDNAAVDQFNEDFIDAIARKKLQKCGEASKLNFEVNRRWAFGLGSSLGSFSADDIPNIGADRPGAFPKALELALRIRNLEAIVNKPPETSNLCDGDTDNCVQIGSIVNQNRIDNERTVKAFYSAWRNLGGSKDRELKQTFKMTEIAPAEIQIEGGEKSLSYTFIPNNSVARQKRYLDLKLYTINFATFYTQMSPQQERGGTFNVDAGCKMTKVATPVPAYPFGFEKNPKAMTYYAIRGEAKFNGLFNPLRGRIPLTAYAMAKPFGGRIGPKLFDVKDTSVTPRTDNKARRSSPYVFGIKPGNTTSGSQIPSILPFQPEFWVQDRNEVIGGDSDGLLPKYVVPNLHYDIEPGQQNAQARYYTNNENIFVMDAPIGASDPYPVGLYNKEQYKRFFNNLSPSNNANAKSLISRQDVNDAIGRVRSPTEYDARNYLIPTYTELNSRLGVNSFAMAQNQMEVFAPLYGPNFLYQNSANILEIMETFVSNQKPSIDRFTQTMLETRQILLNQPSVNSEEILADEAADLIYDTPLTCNSVAGKFAYFYLGKNQSGVDETGCEKPFIESLREYFDDTNLVDSEFYREPSEPMIRADLPLDKARFLFSAYAPGETRGFDSASGEGRNLFSRKGTKDLRNFYSTKFISFDTYLRYNDAGLYNDGRVPKPEPIANPLNLDISAGEIYR